MGSPGRRVPVKSVSSITRTEIGRRLLELKKVLDDVRSSERLSESQETSAADERCLEKRVIKWDMVLV
jgi:hypothetical protein